MLPALIAALPDIGKFQLLNVLLVLLNVLPAKVQLLTVLPAFKVQSQSTEFVP